MSNFQRLDIIFFIKRFQKPKSRESEYKVCRGIIRNQITFGLNRIKYFVEWEREEEKESGKCWTDEKYMFRNLEEAQDESERRNKILSIDQRARREKSKI